METYRFSRHSAHRIKQPSFRGFRHLACGGALIGRIRRHGFAGHRDPGNDLAYRNNVPFMRLYSGQHAVSRAAETLVIVGDQVYASAAENGHVGEA